MHVPRCNIVPTRALSSNSSSKKQRKENKYERGKRKINLQHPNRCGFKSPDDFDKVKSTKSCFCGRALGKDS
jgi:hypothetical protein